MGRSGHSNISSLSWFNQNYQQHQLIYFAIAHVFVATDACSEMVHTMWSCTIVYSWHAHINTCTVCSCWRNLVNLCKMVEGHIEAAVLRRMLFSTTFLPPNFPHRWELVAEFANRENSSGQAISSESARLSMENMQVMDAKAFISDQELAKELISLEYGSKTKQPVGIPLVPEETNCRLCGGKLLLRGDRPCRLTLYTETFGTVPGMLFHKYCQSQRKGCKFVQFYGYWKWGKGSLRYSENCLQLPYFLSTRETGFEMGMLIKFDTELLIGQVSYQQKASIYNVSRGYDSTKKVCTTEEKVKEDRVTPVHG